MYTPETAKIRTYHQRNKGYKEIPNKKFQT